MTDTAAHASTAHTTAQRSDRHARSAATALERGLNRLRSGNVGDALADLGAAKDLLARAGNDLALALIREEVRARFPDAVAVELNISGRRHDLIAYTPRLILDKDARVLWTYRDSRLSDDTIADWERDLAGTCAEILSVPRVPDSSPAIDPAIVI